MGKIFRFIGVVGFFVCLILMYTTDLGERGLRKHDADFQMLDTSFHYTADDVGEAFETLGEEGIATYHKFWILDFVFIACFLIAMLSITNKVAKSGWIRNILILLLMARAGFDVVENSLLIYLSNTYSVRHDGLATMCSWFTTSKFIALYIWMLGIAVMYACSIVKRKRSRRNHQEEE